MKKVFALMALMLVLAPVAGQAATCTTFLATAVAFGVYTGTVVSPGSSNISINCPSGQTYQILLNQGASSGGTETVRQMSNGTYRLNYGLLKLPRSRGVLVSLAGQGSAVAASASAS